MNDHLTIDRVAKAIAAQSHTDANSLEDLALAAIEAMPVVAWRWRWKNSQSWAYSHNCPRDLPENMEFEPLCVAFSVREGKS